MEAEEAVEDYDIVSLSEDPTVEEESQPIQIDPDTPIELVRIDGQPEEEDVSEGKTPPVEVLCEEPCVDAESSAVEVNDARSKDQWALKSMHAREAWALAKANREVTVAVIDMGFDVSHEDLAKNVVAPYNSFRSEERRVGKECRSRWSPYH